LNRLIGEAGLFCHKYTVQAYTMSGYQDGQLLLLPSVGFPQSAFDTVSFNGISQLFSCDESDLYSFTRIFAEAVSKLQGR